jgi:hypothetical protein
LVFGLRFYQKECQGQLLCKDHIKECCGEAGIIDLVNYVDYSGGKALEHSEPKYKLITNHTGRKTFITNSIMLGMNTKTIKEITGHKKDSVFNKYVKITEEFKKLEMDRTWDKISIEAKKTVKKNVGQQYEDYRNLV